MKRFIGVLWVAMLLSIPMAMALGQSPDTLVARTIGNLTTYNPLLATDAASGTAYTLIWSEPFELDRFTGQPIPGLTTWTVSEDGLTYTFTIRDDAVWSDGTPITSADAKFSLDAPKSELVQSPRAANVQRVQEVNIIDDRTYEVVLSEVYCTVMYDLVNFYPLPSHKFAPDFSDFMDSPMNLNPDIASGPYILEEWAPDEFQRFRANPTYWGGEPHIPFWINRILVDPAIANQSMLAGETDYSSMRGGEFNDFPMNDNFVATPVTQNTVALLMLNWADPDNPVSAYDEEGNLVEQPPHPIFSDKRVRQAIAMGYNREDVIASTGEGGGAAVVGSVVPSLAWAFNTEIDPWGYDPEAAAALLDEAGWVLNPDTGIREKDGVPLAFEIAYTPLYGYFTSNALIAQDQLTQLGMDVTVTSLELGALLNDVFLAQKFDAVVISFGGGSQADPDAIAYPLTRSANDVVGSGFNATSYVNLEYDQLMEQARAIPGCSVEDRAPLYYEIQRIQKEDVVGDFVFSPSVFHVVNKRVLNFDPGPWWILTQTAEQYSFGA